MGCIYLKVTEQPWAFTFLIVGEKIPTMKQVSHIGTRMNGLLRRKIIYIKVF